MLAKVQKVQLVIKTEAFYSLVSTILKKTEWIKFKEYIHWSFFPAFQLI